MQENDQSVQPPLGRNPANPAVGRVFLVGAGPGDPGLLTLRGLECLQLADVVLYDGLTNASLLDFAPAAECISVGKHGGEPIWQQADINQRMLALAARGLTVVRLKGGDPAVFARTAEELEALQAGNIPFEVVPGITAALAAASYVGIPITHRQHASAVALITGQQQADEPQSIDWSALARFPGTIVFYMGVTTVAKWSHELMRAGKSPQTPAAIIRRCSWSDQTVVRCRLDEVSTTLTPAAKFRPPVIVIIGAVASLGENFDWFSSRPLMGCGVLITRAQGQSDELATLLRQLGAEVYVQPVLEIKPPDDVQLVHQATRDLANHQYDVVSFSSVNGIDGLMQSIAHLGFDSRIFADVKLATVGQATANHLIKYGLRADIVPTNYSADGLLQSLPSPLLAQRWLVTATNLSRDLLPNGLRQRGANVQTLITYRTTPVTKLKPGVESALRSGRIQWVTITSCAIADSARELLREFVPDLRPVSLSQAISQRLQELNWPSAAQAQSHDTASLVAALRDALRS